MTPLSGEAFLISAINLMKPESLFMASLKFLRLSISDALKRTSFNGIFAFKKSSLFYFFCTISLRRVITNCKGKIRPSATFPVI